ncbi:hypothetical protein AGABI2DRAFT_175644 [Agaricus bisporus var. bisporus H97]|uniref:hypothetical protein n=1 Tax=Agaricus bisporus var. bisporus (strain H97 / ATCC MYA-4626 / FGSC 10389) TaxID=936046 RepID=UPI00029F64AB|nr:hypothetical protein AGABI2DRAFT_175644 [Agaricus bisporus var. bisporus H97]EKV50908.1 hypothetical protein AGABI2DRAFT_175644 [Agaricus bisporus var. bisporus H97]
MGLHLSPLLLPQVVAINFTGGIFLGFFFISALYANRWMLFTDDGWKLRKDIHWHALATTNITFVLVVLTQGLIVSTSMRQAAAVEHGIELGQYKEPVWVPILKCTTSGFVVLLADSVLMHRLWVTHSRRMALMWLPVILFLGSVSCVAMQLFLMIKHIDNPDFGPYEWANVNMDVGPGIVFLPFLASTIVLNAYCTGLIIWRVRKSLKFVGKSASARQLQILIRILMESGVLYLVMSIAHFIAYFGHDNFPVRMNGTLHTVVTGIAYDLIIIRVGQNRIAEGPTTTTGSERLTTFQVADRNFFREYSMDA